MINKTCGSNGSINNYVSDDNQNGVRWFASMGQHTSGILFITWMEQYIFYGFLCLERDNMLRFFTPMEKPSKIRNLIKMYYFDPQTPRKMHF